MIPLNGVSTLIIYLKSFEWGDSKFGVRITIVEGEMREQPNVTWRKSLSFVQRKWSIIILLANPMVLLKAGFANGQGICVVDDDDALHSSLIDA